MNHVMIDIETLGNIPGSVITSIAAVRFNAYSGEIGDRFLVNIDIDDSLSHGLAVNGGTIKWWLSQNEHARAALVEGQKEAIGVSDACMRLNDFLGYNSGVTYYWSNGAGFDLPMLRVLFERVVVKSQIKYNGERCFRTIANLVDQSEWPQRDKEKAHDPMFDCEAQVAVLSYVVNKLMLYV